MLRLLSLEPKTATDDDEDNERSQGTFRQQDTPKRLQGVRRKSPARAVNRRGLVQSTQDCHGNDDHAGAGNSDGDDFDDGDGDDNGHGDHGEQ